MAAALFFLRSRAESPAHTFPWPGVFLSLAALTTLNTLARRLPLQNILWAAALIGTLGSIMEIVGVATGFPFGAHQFQDPFGKKLLEVLPWPVPLAWVVLVLNCRGVARLVMRPWRKHPHYGTWVIVLAGVVGVVLDFSLQPFATLAQDYWRWQVRGGGLNWHSAPWTNFIGRFCAIEVMLFLATPWLLSKVPIKYPTDYHPLLIWSMLMAVFISGNARQHLGSAAFVGIVTLVLVVGAALLGALWKVEASAPPNGRRERRE